MRSLTVWRFATPDAADETLPHLERLATAGQITVDDAVVVSWPRGLRKPSTRGLGSLTGQGVLWGGAWGVLLALIFLAPIAGPAFGAAAGAVAGSLSDFGIEDDFIRRVRDAVTPGSSALFVLSSSTVANVLTAELDEVELVRCDLSVEQEQRLRAALGQESEDWVG